MSQRLDTLSERDGMRLELDTIIKLRAALGYPDSGYRTVHIAGTNGKGSVATKIAKGLELDGKKVGLFTSPHLHALEERFCLNGKPLEIEQGLAHIFAVADARHLDPTYFEVCVALALHLFAESLVDYGVFEVGMGGRLDATNVLQPELTVITSIGLDHTEVLGESLQKIAQEKGGIIKKEVPLILGPLAQNLGLEEIAKAHNAPCQLVKGNFVDYREENGAIANIALDALSVSCPSIKAACAHNPPGRFQQFSCQNGQVIFDVAHNPSALIRLFQLIKATYPGFKRRIIAGFTKGSDIEEMVEICSKEGPLHLVRLNCPRAVPMGATFEEALANWDRDEELLILCGSCYLVSEAVEGLERLSDSERGGGRRTIYSGKALLPS